MNPIDEFIKASRDCDYCKNKDCDNCSTYKELTNLYYKIRKENPGWTIGYTAEQLFITKIDALGFEQELRKLNLRY